LWFNKRESCTLSAMSRNIDLNPVRAELVQDPKA
jgi:hypothetical protein